MNVAKRLYISNCFTFRTTYLLQWRDILFDPHFYTGVGGGSMHLSYENSKIESGQSVPHRKCTKNLLVHLLANFKSKNGILLDFTSLPVFIYHRVRYTNRKMRKQNANITPFTNNPWNKFNFASISDRISVHVKHCSIHIPLHFDNNWPFSHTYINPGYIYDRRQRHFPHSLYWIISL